ncbi:unnamed protein product [Phytomonas sp. EM1]|nr:unnamed protein product [Phytomonas sp. EM1]|eukprot:CCW62420.1 unnamed protein product [Phytomonas sp. isolate EM1]
MHTFSGLSILFVALTLLCVRIAVIEATAATSGKTDHDALGFSQPQRPWCPTSSVDVDPRDIVSNSHITRLKFSDSCEFLVDDMKVEFDEVNGAIHISPKPRAIPPGGTDMCTVEDPVDRGLVYYLQGFYLHASPERSSRGGTLYMCFTNIESNETMRRALMVVVFLKECSVGTTFSSTVEHLLDNSSLSKPHRKIADPLGKFSISLLLPMQQSYVMYQGSEALPMCGPNVQWVVMTSPIGVTSPLLGKLQTAQNESTTSDSRILWDEQPSHPVRGRKIYHFIDLNHVSEPSTRELNSTKKVLYYSHRKKGTKGIIPRGVSTSGCIDVGKKDLSARANRTSSTPSALTRRRRRSQERLALNTSVDVKTNSSTTSSTGSGASHLAESSFHYKDLKFLGGNASPTLGESSPGWFGSIILRVINYIKEHYIRVIVYFILALIFLSATISAFKSRYRPQYFVGISPEEERLLFSSSNAYRYGIF